MPQTQGDKSSGLMGVKAFCEWADISRSRFYRLVKSGRLDPVYEGRKPLLSIHEAERWAASLTPNGAIDNHLAPMIRPIETYHLRNLISDKERAAAIAAVYWAASSKAEPRYAEEILHLPVGPSLSFLPLDQAEAKQICDRLAANMPAGMFEFFLMITVEKRGLSRVAQMLTHVGFNADGKSNTEVASGVFVDVIRLLGKVLTKSA